MRPHGGERSVLAHAHGAVGLDGAVDDLERDLGHLDLGLCDLAQGVFGVALVDLDGGVEHDQARSVDLDARLGHPLEQHAVLGQRLAKGDLAGVVQPVDQPLERALRRADGAHRVVDASGAQAALHDLEAAALAEDHGVQRHAHVGEGDVAVAVRGVVVAEHAEHAVHRDTGGVGGHQHHRLLAVLVWVVGVGFAHDDEDLASVIASSARPPFGSVEHVVVATSLHPHLDVAAVRRRDVGLRHQEPGSDLACQ